MPRFVRLAVPIVTILPDSGARYVSERFWTEAEEEEEASRG
jgi:hypothetical protein